MATRIDRVSLPAAPSVRAVVIYGDAPLNRLTRWSGFAAMTIGRYIFVASGSDRASERLLRHELIHVAQQEELWWVGQWALYGLERLWRYAQLLTGAVDRKREVGMWREAYYNISFEREAYDNEGNPRYLTLRKKHAWRKYL